MENKYGIVGVAHIGLPTNDLQKTVEFYKSLGLTSHSTPHRSVVRVEHEVNTIMTI